MNEKIKIKNKKTLRFFNFKYYYQFSFLIIQGPQFPQQQKFFFHR